MTSSPHSARRSHTLVLMLCASLLLISSGCGLFGEDEPATPDPVVLGDTTDTRMLTGTMQYVELEGGFWVIEGTTGSGPSATYRPINLPASFQVDGQRVEARVVIRDDLGSIYMQGTAVELRSIAPR